MKSIKFRRADNNGQVCRTQTNEQNIGNRAMGTLDITNGEIRSILRNKRLNSKQRILHAIKREKENLAAYRSYGGNCDSRIDYITIGKRYRNWVTDMCIKENANIINAMQHRAIIANVKITLKANYFVTKT